MGYIALCTRYIRFDTFHIAGYISLCTGYIRFDTFHIAEYIALCTRYIHIVKLTINSGSVNIGLAQYSSGIVWAKWLP
ncbi:hypothetical protein H5410_011649 [Solanum commersonii]|uniref:Uncharacterized protein n=1 Tax=Solanum commersonii TaxID=4109 RepID=A0A9J6AQP6_SOLCO|nr:hypothetical protein H5410_011649 [Solanum commersonii]